MIPISLTVKNFMGYGSSHIDFSILSNAILIVGNEDGSSRKSNAVGKTTLFNAIKFVLFNARTSKAKDDVIRRGTKKCNVVFEFTAPDGSVYKIDRSRTAKVNNVSLFIRNNNAWEDKTQRRNSDTDKDILNIIGMNLQTFENSLYFKQSDLFNLASTTREKRKEIIKDMLNLAVWDKYKKIASKYKDETNSKLEIVVAKLQEYVGPNEDINLDNELNELKSTLSNTIKAKQRVEEEISKLKVDLEEKSKQLNAIKNIVGDKAKIEEQYRNALLYKDETADNYKKIIEEIDKINKNIKDNNEKLTIKKSMAAGLVGRIAELTKYIEIKPDEVAHNNLEKLLSGYASDIRENESLRSRLSKKLPDDDFCPTCGSELDLANRDTIQQSKSNRLAKITNTLDQLYECRDEASTALSVIRLDIEKYKDNLDNICSFDSKLTLIKDEIDSLKDNSEDLLKKHDWLISKQDVAKKSMETALTGYERAKQLKVALMGQQGLNETKRLEEEIDYINDNIYEYETSHQEAVGSEAVLREKIINEEEKIGKVKKLNTDRKKLEYDLNLYSTATFAFSSHGVPFMIISSVLDAIQTETNNVLYTLRNGTQIQFVVDKNDKDTLDMKFFIGSEEWSWEQLSGGQQGSVAVALKFAMAVVNRKRCGADVKLLMLDEVDQPLDEESVDLFYKIIKEWSKDMVIMVITHNKQLRAKFSDCILVKKQQNVSSASVVVS